MIVLCRFCWVFWVRSFWWEPLLCSFRKLLVGRFVCFYFVRRLLILYAFGLISWYYVFLFEYDNRFLFIVTFIANSVSIQYDKSKLLKFQLRYKFLVIFWIFFWNTHPLMILTSSYIFRNTLCYDLNHLVFHTFSLLCFIRWWTRFCINSTSFCTKI